MRVAYACRDLASDSVTGVGAQTFARAAAMAAVGHDVHLISLDLAEPWHRRLGAYERLRWRPVDPERRDHVYFTEGHSYADRLYDTVLALHAEAPIDVVDVAEAGGEALTILRAKRLLRQLRTTCIAVNLRPESTTPYGEEVRWPTGFGANLIASAESYSRTHADVLLSATGPRGTCYLPGLPDGGPQPVWDTTGDAGLTVLWLGEVRPGAGLGTVLCALARAREKEPELRLVVRGTDTLTDPCGRSYWQFVRDRMDERLHDAVTFEGPLRMDELGLLPPAGTQCVLATGFSAGPTDALLAMAAGHLVIAVTGSAGAALMRHAKGGLLLQDWDELAVADALLAGTQASAAAIQVAVDSAHEVRNGHSLRKVAERLQEVYRSAPVRSDSGAVQIVDPTETISVVIPLYNEGQFLPAAIEAIRNSGLVDPEIVVVDDGSTDLRTLSVLRATPGVTHVHQPHRGLSAARNRGIEEARGDLILMLDADDLVAPGFLPQAVDALRRSEGLAFVAGYVRYFGLLDLVYVPAGSAGALSLVLHTHLKSMVLYRREALERVGGYDEDLPAFEDWEIQLRLALTGYDSDVLPIVGQLYRRHSKSMSFTASNGMRSELVQYLVRKHAPTLGTSQLIELVANVVDLWKTGYEPSRSVILQASAPVDDT